MAATAQRIIRAEGATPDARQRLYREVQEARTAYEASGAQEKTAARERLVDVLMKFHTAVFGHDAG